MRKAVGKGVCEWMGLGGGGWGSDGDGWEMDGVDG